MVTVNYICLTAADLLFNLSIAEISAHYNLLFNILFIALVYVVLKFFQHLFRQKWHLAELSLPTPLLITCLFFLGICAAIFICSFTFGEQIGYPKGIVRLNAVLFMAFFILGGLLLFFIVRMILQNQEAQTRLKYLEAAHKYSGTLEASYQELRKFRHDYKNLLLGLSGYLETGDIDGMKHYFSDTLVPFSNEIEETWGEASLSLLEIPEVKGLCLNKALAAHAQGISVKFLIPAPVRSLHMELVDFIRILGIYFDNALEAVRETEVKEVTMSLCPDQDGFTLILSNSCSKPKIPMEKLSVPGYTTKGPGHGNGLSIARDILKQYPDINSGTYLKNGCFVQEINQL